MVCLCPITFIYMKNTILLLHLGKRIFYSNCTGGSESGRGYVRPYGGADEYLWPVPAGAI